MSLETQVQFYYGHVITVDNRNLAFDEGGPELDAVLDVGGYTLEDFATEVARAMTAAGGQTYAATVERTARIITITAAGSFTLLEGTGATSGTSVFGLLGFTAGDIGPTTSAVGDTASGSSYRPQFFLKDFVDSSDLIKRTQSSVNESASGVLEVISFGTVNFTELNIPFITDIDQGSNGAIETNLTGVTDARAFLTAITTKNPLEFMKDRDSIIFEKLILESTPEARDGTGYRLNELFNRGLAGYYETGKLVFRVTT